MRMSSFTEGVIIAGFFWVMYRQAVAIGLLREILEALK